MATNYNYFGNLVTSGLVLDLDAAKIDSYPGSGTIWRDISGNNLTGSLVNGPTFTGIGKQAAIVFDGTDDYTVISSSALLAAGTNDFCADFWLYPTSYPTLANPVFVTEGTNGIWVGRNGSNFVLRAYAVADRIQNPILPATGSWTNVSITRNGTNNIMYYNGAPSATSASNQNYAQFSTYIGSDGPGGGGATYFNGRIASSKYYNRGLSQFEVWQNFNAIKGRYGIPDIVTNGLVLNLDAGNPYSYLSGSSGTKWTNTVAISSSISGTLVNGPVYANGAITFDGVDDYVNCGTTDIIPGSWTVSAWVKHIPKTGAAVYFGRSGTAPNYDQTAIIGWSSNVSNRFFTSGKTTSGTYLLSCSSSFSPISGVIYNVVGTFDTSSTTLNLHINGVLDNTKIVGTLFTTGSNLSNQIGCSDGLTPSNFAQGNIYDVKVYNRALSAAEVLQNFNALRGRYGI
jgi:hypothetical protein